MSYPYVGDFVNQIFGVYWNIPIPTFGTFVATALVISVYFARKEVIRLESLGILAHARIYSKANSSYSLVPTYEIVTNLALHSALFGIVGARLFHVLEYTDTYFSNPIHIIFSQGGFSIFGGLIFGVVAGIFYLKKCNVPIAPMLDAVAPAMILGYGVGRIGCQLSGDGDWGIASNIYLKPDWLPDWFWAQTYENNIAGVVIQSPGVYPTPIYEALLAFCIFVFLMAIRKTSYQTGFLFSVYLLLSGLQRFCIEKIRINSEYNLFGLYFTQAELISTLLVIFGLLGIFKTTKHKHIPKVAFPIFAILALSACAML